MHWGHLGTAGHRHGHRRSLMVVQMNPYRRRYAQKATKTSPVSSVPRTFLAYFAGKRLNRALYPTKRSWQELEHLQLVVA